MKPNSVEGFPPPQAPSKGEVREAMSRILASKHFVNAPTKQKFLQLICESYLTGRAFELNEYMIGCEVYGRDGNYNPALDPIVRVGAHGLRKRLEAYYKGVGKHDGSCWRFPPGVMFLLSPATHNFGRTANLKRPSRPRRRIPARLKNNRKLCSL